MKSVCEFNFAMKQAREANLRPLQEAVGYAVSLLESQMDAAIKNPTDAPFRVTNRIPLTALYGGKYNAFLHLLNNELFPFGWVANETTDETVYRSYPAYHVQPRPVG